MPAVNQPDLQVSQSNRSHVLADVVAWLRDTGQR